MKFVIKNTSAGHYLSIEPTDATAKRDQAALKYLKDQLEQLGKQFGSFSFHNNLMEISIPLPLDK